MIISILWVLAAMTIVMAAGWLYQRAAQNGGWTDVFWTYGTGITCSLVALSPFGINSGATWRKIFVATLVAIWALRLGTYVALRVSHSREDVRYATLRQNWGAKFQSKMFGLLIIQAPITALLSISVLFAARQPDVSVRFQDILGLVILAASIVGEAIADSQMKRFKADKSNEGKVCNRGLWGWSRHPNYFFEVLVWIAYPVIGLDFSNPASLMTLIAPALMFLVIRFGTGVPSLEAAMLKSKGTVYRRYQARVNAIFPWPPKKSHSGRWG